MDLVNFQVKVSVRTIVDVLDERPNALAYHGSWKRPICRGVIVDLRHPDPHLFPTSRPHRTITTLTFLSALSLHDQANQRQDIVDYFPPIVDP